MTNEESSRKEISRGEKRIKISKPSKRTVLRGYRYLVYLSGVLQKPESFKHMPNKQIKDTTNMTKKIRKEFKLSYQLSSTEDHTIDADLLGQSLINMAGMLKEADKIINGEDSNISVEVRAHEEGSFMVDMVTWLNEGGIDILKTLGITVTGGVVTAATFFQAIKAMRGRNITVKARTEEGKWSLTLDDGEQIECTEEMEKLLSNYSFRKKVDEVINKPTNGEEAATISFIEVDDETGEETTTEVIKQEEAEFFKAPPRKIFALETIEEKDIEVRFTVLSLEKQTGWRVRLPDDTEVPVKITDEGFLERANQREGAVIKGDLFVVRMKTIIKNIDGKDNTTREIIRVIRHRVDKDKKVV